MSQGLYSIICSTLRESMFMLYIISKTDMIFGVVGSIFSLSLTLVHALQYNLCSHAVVVVVNIILDAVVVVVYIASEYRVHLRLFLFLL